ncbi:MAG: transcription elongation factor GreA [Chloroflexi bacterium]|nr:transcription elongation factor GreA [Chloroflexota bacterium]
MAEQRPLLTPEGLQEIQKELDFLKTVRRPEIAEMIREAREGGDISESAAYEDAKQQQGFVEGRIQELEWILREAVVIEERAVDGTVGLGSRVKVKTSNGRESMLTIVGSHEAQPRDGRISNESPVGRALMHHKAGETVSVDAPAGQVTYTILTVE